MSPAAATGDPVSVPIAIAGFPVSWAGPGGRDEDFCFGSEDGRLHFTTVGGVPIGGFVSGVENAEAINGVAFIGPVIAVSTRADVTFWTLPRPGSQLAQRAVFPCGAHGVLATAAGAFVAPLGRTGLMKVRAGHAAEQLVQVGRASGRPLSFYKAVTLHSYGRPEVIVCAARQDGVVATPLRTDEEWGPLSSLSFPGLDVVDVCPLGTGTTPPAVAAVGRDGTLVLFDDVLHSRNPVTLRFPQVPGVPYRVFCALGSVILLTSEGVFVLAGLAERFLAGDCVASTPCRVRTIRSREMVDANVCADRWLLAVCTDGVLRFDLEQLVCDEGGERAGEIISKPEGLTPSWRPTEEVAESVPMAG